MKKWEIITPITEFTGLSEIEEPFKQLVIEAKNASKQAYAPYSNFKVGAAVLLQNGKIIKGNNQENAAYPSGLCAERVAIFYANANYPEQAIEGIAIAAQNEQGYIKTPVAPCGSCRQVLLESEIRFNKAIKVYLYGEDSILKLNKIQDTLPLCFDGKQLK